MNAAPIAKVSLAALAVLGLVAPAAASVIAYQVPAGTSGNQSFGGELGMEFNVLSPITVSELGVFDDGSNGLSRNLTANLWDRTSTASPLASLSFTAADPGTLVDGSRFKPLATPLSLPAGFQGTISASGYGSGEQNGNSGGATPTWTTDDGGGALSFVGSSRWGNSAGVYPPNADGGPANRYAAGTFAFDDAGSPPAHVVVPVANASFELPNVPTSPGWLGVSPDGWTKTGSNGGLLLDTLGGVPTTPDGNQAAWLDSRSAGSAIYTKVADTLWAADWMLSVYVGDRGNLPLPSYNIGFWADTDADDVPDAPLGVATSPVIPDNEFLLASVMAPDVPQGTSLYLQFDVPPGPGATEQALFDLVQVQAAPNVLQVIPEPATILIWSLLAGLGIAASRRPRRRA